jgi:hypothetical protein
MYLPPPLSGGAVDDGLNRGITGNSTAACDGAEKNAGETAGSDTPVCGTRRSSTSTVRWRHLSSE